MRSFWRKLYLWWDSKADFIKDVIVWGVIIIAAVIVAISPFPDLVEYILIGVSCFAIYMSCKYRIDERVRSRMTWFLTEKDSNLLNHIQKECVGVYIDTKYLITEKAERNAAIEIIKGYRQYTQNRYISCCYVAKPELALMSFDEYFMSHLVQYLENLDTTDDVAYCKLLYMAVLYCENSAFLNKDHNYWSGGIRKTLDNTERSNTIGIS